MTTPYYASLDGEVILHHADALDVLPTLSDASVDAVVCDPPYGLAELATETVLQAIAAWMAGDRTHVPDGPGGFMGRNWDRFVPPPGVWDECLRVLKPGGHLLAFAGSRTVDLMGLSIRIAGFQLRDTITWHYGSGMPKGIDVSKAIDKAAGAERKTIGPPRGIGGRDPQQHQVVPGSEVYTGRWGNRWAANETAPSTDDAARWSGWNTQLKPGAEPIVVARKSLDGTVAANVLRHGTGALNVDGCRTPIGAADAKAMERANSPGSARMKPGGSNIGAFSRASSSGPLDTTAGRWPTNVLLTHSPLLAADGEIIGDACADGCVAGCAVAEMDRQSGVRTSGAMRAGTPRSNRSGWSGDMPAETGAETYGDTGGASRFFPIFRYEAKAPASERPRLPDGTAWPTVKPLDLMSWLVRLVTPPGGVVLDWCAGTGTTLQAAVAEGMRAIGIEREQDGADLCVIRLARPVALGLFPAS